MAPLIAARGRQHPDRPFEGAAPLVYTSTADRQEQSRLHVRQARAFLRDSRFPEGIRDLEAALELDPANVEAVLLMRQVEQAAGEAWRQGREEALVRELESARGTGRWPHLLLKAASFQNAPGLMRWLVRNAENDRTAEPTVAASVGTGPRASFIVPVYNRGVEVRRTVRSVLDQTHSGWELILVDDASTDDSRDVLYALRDRHPSKQISVVTLDRNAGRPGARNAGARQAHGEFLVLLDSDDRIAPRFLEKTLALADAHPEAAWIAPLSVQYGDVNRLFGFERFDPGVLVLRNQFTITNLLRRDVFVTLGGLNEDMRQGLEDWEFWIRAVEAGYRPVQLQDVLFFYQRHRRGSVSGWFDEDGTRELAAKQQIVQAHPMLYRPLDEASVETLRTSAHIPASLLKMDGFTDITARPNPLTDRVEEAATAAQGATVIVNHRPAPDESVNDTECAVPSGERRKILFVCHDFPPYRFAGAQLYAYHLARELIGIGHDVRVLYAHDYSRVAETGARPYDLLEDRYNEVPVYQVVVDDSTQDLRVHPQFAYDNPRVEAVFRDLLQREGFDAVHFHLLYRLGANLPRASHELGIPSFATLHDYWLLCAMGHMIDTQGRECNGPASPEKCAACLAGFPAQGPAPDLVSFARQRSVAAQDGYRWIDRVLAPSRFLAKVHAQYGFPAPEVHPLGWLPVERLARKPRGEKVVFGYCGQIVYRKGLDILLAALMKLPRGGWELHIHGKNYQQGFFDAVMEAVEAHPDIQYLGEYTPEDLPRIYATLDVAVMPSRRENYPLTVLEALSAGVPVVASDVGGVREMMVDGRDGMVFRNESVEDLQRILAGLTSHPETIDTLRATGHAPKTIAENAREIANLYDQAWQAVPRSL